jgi:hypothetical protein
MMNALFCFSLPQIYEEFYHTINNADHEKDLKWWSNTHGVNMAMNWPYFEVSHVLLWEKCSSACIYMAVCYCGICIFTFEVSSIFLMHCDPF